MNEAAGWGGLTYVHPWQLQTGFQAGVRQRGPTARNT